MESHLCQLDDGPDCRALPDGLTIHGCGIFAAAQHFFVGALMSVNIYEFLAGTPFLPGKRVGHVVTRDVKFTSFSLKIYLETHTHMGKHASAYECALAHVYALTLALLYAHRGM